MSLKAMVTEERVRFVRFCVVGASGVIVNLAIFTLFMNVVLVTRIAGDDDRFLAANFAGFLVSVLTNFLLNDFWTWGDREKQGHDHFFRRLGKFYVVSSIAGAVQLGVAFGARSWFGLWDQLAVLVGIGVATVINFVANHLWTFGEKPEPATERRNP